MNDSGVSKDSVPEGFLSPKIASKLLQITHVTLRTWAENGRIDFIRAEGKNSHRKYNVRKFLKLDNEQPVTTKTRRKIIYARVSTKKQSENLQRQINMLREKFPSHELIQDIGSGINFKRKGLGKILDIAIKRNLEEVVVAYKDRLCRIGFELFEQLFTKLSNAKIVVLNESNCSPDEELAEDILTIVTVFSATINGRKRYKSRKKGEIDYNEIKNFLSQGGEQTTT